MTIRVYECIAIVCVLVSLCGCDADRRAGKTGNQWKSSDFPATTSELVNKGSQELAAYFIEQKSYDISGAGGDKVEEIIAKYPPQGEDDISHFAVLVKEKLQQAGLLDAEDKNRFQYSLESLASIYASE